MDTWPSILNQPWITHAAWRHQDACFFNAPCPISLSRRAPKLLGEIVGKFRGQVGSPSTPRGGRVGQIYKTRRFNLAEPWRLHLTHWGVSWRGCKICTIGLTTHPTQLGGVGGRKREVASARPAA